MVLPMVANPILRRPTGGRTKFSRHDQGYGSRSDRTTHSGPVRQDILEVFKQVLTGQALHCVQDDGVFLFLVVIPVGNLRGA